MHALIRDAAGGRWLTGAEPVAVLQARESADVPALLDEVEQRARRDRLHAIGFLTYEAASGLDPKLDLHAPGVLPPGWFALFRHLVPAALPVPGLCPELDWQPSLDPGCYRRAVAAIRGYIAAGDTYQVNFSYRLRASLDGATPDTPRQLFADMVARQPAGLGAFIDTEQWAVCCASHELLLSRRGRQLTSRPMKGTAHRGDTPDADARQAEWLQASPKNRAENLMITDMVRNDIGRLAEVGTVRTEALFRLERYPTLWQMTSTVHGESDAGLSRLLRALFPAASITGAPKRRTMALIRELEHEPREIYTGTIGLIAPDGDLQLNVAIRTAWIDKTRHQAEYGVGGGILWDSDAEEELDETRTKARILGFGSPPLELLETLLWQPAAGYWLLEAHLERLEAAGRVFFGGPPDRRVVTSHLWKIARQLSAEPHRVRLLVGGNGQVQVSAAPLAAHPAPDRVTLARDRYELAGHPLVCHKTTRRELYDAVRQAALSAVPSAHDVLLINQQGEVTESTIANLVVELDGVLYTPPAVCGLLPGVYRRHLLETQQVRERVLVPDDVRRASRLYLANSVRGLWPVALVES